MRANEPTRRSSHMRFPASRYALCLTTSLVLLLAACGGGEDGGQGPKDQPKFPEVDLTLMHINDHHSQLDAFPNTELQIDGVATRVELGGFARVTSAFICFEVRFWASSMISGGETAMMSPV